MQKTITKKLLGTALLCSALNYAQALPVDGPQVINPSVLSPMVAEMVAETIKPNYDTGITNRLVSEHGFTISLDNRKIMDIGGKANEKSAKNDSAQIMQTANAAPPVYGISLDGVYSDSLSSTVPEKWYVFSVSTALKITTLLQQIPANHNYDIALYSMPTGATNYNYYAGSYMAGNADEQLSAIGEPGDYLLMISANGPATTGNYAFGNLSSTGYDNNEPDDNFWQAKSIPTYTPVTGSINNLGDKDFHSFTISESKVINYRITGSDCKAELFYANGNSAFVLNNNESAELTLAAGTYYWSISSPSTANAIVPYHFSSFQKMQNLTFNIESDSQTGYSQKVYWGAGTYFPLYKSARLFGYAYDDNGQPIVNAAIDFTLQSTRNTQTTATAYTNGQGYYSTGISSPTGYGARSFYGARHIYRYDVHGLTMNARYGDNQTSISSITVIDDYSSSTQYTNLVLLNDVAYYIFR